MYHGIDWVNYSKQISIRDLPYLHPISLDIIPSLVFMDTMLADTHCHLDFESFDQDRVEVVRRAGEAGILRILNPGIDMKSSQDAVDNTRRFDSVFAAVGVHPNDGLSWNYATLDGLRELASSPKVVGIGEIGLDYYWDSTPIDLQSSLLNDQLALAAELTLPVVLHVRDPNDGRSRAMNDLLAILEKWIDQLVANKSMLASRPGVLHSFSGDLIAAEKALEMGFWIGISGPVTYKNAEILRDVVKKLPEDKILIETDAPFLTPHPHRGKRNEPGFVRYTAEKIAEIRGIAPEHFNKITADNAARLFHW